MTRACIALTMLLGSMVATLSAVGTANSQTSPEGYSCPFSQNADCPSGQCINACQFTHDTGRPQSDEYTLKAAYIYNFTKFIEWPASSFSSRTSAIKIGVIGSERVYSKISGALRGKKTGDRKISTTHLEWGDELTGYHVLFVTSSSSGGYEELLRLRSDPTVVIGEGSSFVREYGDLTLMVRNSRIVFDASRDIHKRKGVKVSSKLLRLAVSSHQ